jgi:RNAse (barnase) inhibitor barstar
VTTVTSRRTPLEAAVIEAGWEVRAVHSKGSQTRDVLGDFARDLEFPSWFGGNLDALLDCLGDLTADPSCEGLLIVWSGWGEFSEANPSKFAALVGVLDEARTRADRSEQNLAIILGDSGS